MHAEPRSKSSVIIFFDCTVQYSTGLASSITATTKAAYIAECSSKILVCVSPQTYNEERGMYWVRSGDLYRCSHSVVSFCKAAGESHTKHKFAEALASGYEVVSVLRPACTLLQPSPGLSIHNDRPVQGEGHFANFVLANWSVTLIVHPSLVVLGCFCLSNLSLVLRTVQACPLSGRVQ